MKIEQTENLDTNSVFTISNEEFMKTLLKESRVLEPNGTVFCSYCKRPVSKCFGHDLYVNFAYCPCKSD